MGCCLPKASAQDEACPEVKLPNVTFNVIDNPVAPASDPDIETNSTATAVKEKPPHKTPALPARPATPLPTATSPTASAEDSNASSDESSDQPWEQVE